MYWTLADATSLEIKEFLIKEDCGPTIIGVCDSEIVGQDFIDALLNGNAQNVDELLNELSKTRNYFRSIGFPSSKVGPVPENNPFYDCADKMECILNKYLETALCDNSYKIFDKVQSNGGFGVSILYDYKGEAEQRPFVSIGYIYEGGEMKSKEFNPKDHPDNLPVSWDGKDGNMADTRTLDLSKQGNGWRSYINRYLCGDNNAAGKPALNGLEMASLISHELLHTRIAARIKHLCLQQLECDPHGWRTYSVNSTFWKYVLGFYEAEGITAMHQLMEEVFLDDLIEVLMEMNGDTDIDPDNIEKYKYLVLGNIASDPPDNAEASDYDDPNNLPQDLVGLGFIKATSDLDGDGFCCDYADHLLEYERIKSLSETLSPSSLDECPE